MNGNLITFSNTSPKHGPVDQGTTLVHGVV